MNGNNLNTPCLINTKTKVCLGLQSQSLLQPPSSTLCVKELYKCKKACCMAAKSVVLTTSTPTVWTRQVLGYSMLRLPSRMSLSLVPTSPMLLRKLLHQSKVFYIHPDKAFLDWGTQHKRRPPIPPGFVIPILLAMQGHPELPRLWGKHEDMILCNIDLRPIIHEPCLYSGLINDQ